MRARAPRGVRVERITGRERFATPEHLPGATRFSEEKRFYSPEWLITVVRGLPWLERHLRTSTEVHHNWGQPRMDGDWHIAYLAFVISGQVDVQPWVHRTEPKFWRACGFAAPPSYSTVWLRFAELEGFADAFAEAAGMVMRQARKKEPRIGRWIHVDGTEAATHAAAVHDCRRGEGCPREGRFPDRRRQLTAATSDTAAEIRQALAELPEDAEDGGVPDVVVNQVRPAEITERHWDDTRGVMRFRLGDHWYRSRDPEAGTRAYRTGRNGKVLRAWHGNYNHKATDHFAGAPVAVEIHSASESEHAAYPRLMEQAIALTGVVPVAVSADRGYSVNANFEWNARRGIGSVFSYRRRTRHDPERPVAGDRHDEHGVPTCRHCGGETYVTRSAHEPTPRLWFQCVLPNTPECQKEQTISCSHNWRRLVLIPRISPVYAALRQSHENAEHVHREWRARYRSGGKSIADRPKRIGRGCQQLRANAAMLIEWIRVCFRQGWLGNGGRNAKAVKTGYERVLGSIRARRTRLRRATVPQRHAGKAPPGKAPPAAQPAAAAP